MKDPELKRLKEMATEVGVLEFELKKKRDARNRLALKIVDSGRHSLRKVAEYAGVKNPYLVQLRKKK
jgi:hypothetical protein